MKLASLRAQRKATQVENQRSPTASQDSYSVRIIVFPTSVCRKTALYRTSATSVCYTRLCKALFSVYTVSETQISSISTESHVSQVSLRKCIFKTRKIDKNAFATQIRRYPLSFRPRTAALWTGIADLAQYRTKMRQSEISFFASTTQGDASGKPAFYHL